MAEFCMEKQLAWLIAKSVHTRAERRLNEIENMLAKLVKVRRQG